MIRGIGANCDDHDIDGHLDKLARDVAHAEAAGYDAYELSTGAVNAIRCGRLDADEAQRVATVLSAHHLSYTVHPPVDLRLTDASGLGNQIFVSCLELCACIGAQVMVYHSAQLALRPADQDTEQLPDEAGLASLWQRETDALHAMSFEAAKRGITIAVENRDPHLWEIAALRRHGKDAGALLTYHQGMRLDLLVDQVRQIGSPNVGICLDTGHAFLAAPYWQQKDFVTGVCHAAPWIRHVHFHDNFGRLDDYAESLSDRLIFGQADNHLPPGWGRIPLDQVLQSLTAAGYAGWLIVEMRPRYFDRRAEALATVRALLEEEKQGNV